MEQDAHLGNEPQWGSVDQDIFPDIIVHANIAYGCGDHDPQRTGRLNIISAVEIESFAQFRSRSKWNDIHDHALCFL